MTFIHICEALWGLGARYYYNFESYLEETDLGAGGSACAAGCWDTCQPQLLEWGKVYLQFTRISVNAKSKL